MNTFKNIDDYIAQQDPRIRSTLQELRETIKKAAPQAEELISYGMPAYKLNGPLVYFAAYKNHIGFYPTPSAIVDFSEELKVYKSSKGAVQFPIDRSLPLELIDRMVKSRVMDNMQKPKKK